MKIIHCSDLHLDSRMEALSSEKSRARREELIHSFERMVDFASENSVRAIIIAGDMFDTKKVSNKTRKRLLLTIETHKDIDFLYLSGNHDEDNFISSLEYLPDNLKTFGDKWTKYRYADVVISGIRFTTENKGVVYDTLNLDENDKNIVVMHGQTADYKSDKNVEIISLPKLKNKNIDYLALGHIHSFLGNKLGDRGTYCYAGCLEGRGFDELGNKGFVLITVQDGLSYEFIKFSRRSLFAHEFDLSGRESWYSSRLDLLKELDEYSTDSLIKVVLTGEITADFDLDVEGLNKELNEKFYFAKIYDKTELKIDLNDYVADKSVKGEFVRSVMASSLDEDMKRQVILKGLNALKGKEI